MESEPYIDQKSAQDPYREVVRKKMNRKLKRHGEVIDLDSLFGKYDPALWRDGAWSQFGTMFSVFPIWHRFQ